ncbi:hypothetical protein [Sporohalobacter salinus]|uniref:hypothetical protein n=1 Tax=Sporohalobacter salinus TaxID=1494606 RepID=UPI0019603823|nr:hypothetical protein [Sporohalobacter salinus]MBM7623088.1 putative Mn2+ efflux pump MntP [Sporohalobacter salinus]
MEVGTLILLALLVSLDSFYGGIIYRKDWGVISVDELLIIFLVNLFLISLTTLLGKIILALVGTRIAKLVSIMLLGVISLIFSAVIQRSNFLGDKEEFKARIILNALKLDKLKLNSNKRLIALIDLRIMTAIDVILVSFIAAVLTSNTLFSIITFSCIDSLFLKTGNLILRE